MLRPQGEVAGSASACERGVCGDLAGCLFLADRSCDTTPSLRPSPATWRSGTLHRASVPARRALRSVCWGWTGPRGGAAGGAAGGAGTFTALPPRKSRSPPGARGERPEGRDSPSCPTTCTQSPDPRVWTWERELSNRIRQVPRFFPKAHGCPLSGASRMGSGRARSVPGGAVSNPDSHSRGRGARRAQPLRTVLSRLQLSPRLPPGARSPGSRPGSGDPKAGLERSQFWVRGGVCLRQRPREKQSVR